jgi:hypoxanthine-DNA glycosylase
MSRAPSTGFEPIAAADARLLILGSLPGQRSLELQQYYGQPRNAFWGILATVTGVAADAAYEARTAGLLAARIALWDVIAAAHREGSLDSRIERDSVRVNDFERFFARHPQIERVLFNGKTAEALYRRRVLPALSARSSALERVVLPSTSPANAAAPVAARRAAWQHAIRVIPTDLPMTQNRP